MNTRIVNKIFLSCFLGLYLLAGVYLAVVSRKLFYIDLINLLVYGYFVLPLLFAILALIAFIRRKRVDVYLWICSIFWAFDSVGVLMIEELHLPNTAFIILMLSSSVTCMIYLVVGRNQYFGSE